MIEAFPLPSQLKETEMDILWISNIIFPEAKALLTGDIYESNELQYSDQERISRILDAIVSDGRIAKVEGVEKQYIKK